MMTKPTQERIERVAEVIRDEYAIRNSMHRRFAMEIAEAALAADDSHLAAENARLREALEKISEWDFGDNSDANQKAYIVSTEALNNEKTNDTE